MKLNEKKILFIIAPKNFRDEELFEPRRILETYGAKTFVACREREATGSLGGNAKADVLITNVLVSDYDAIIFVGGVGSAVYYEDKIALNIIKEAKLKGKIIGGICAGSGVLAKAGILNKITCTGWEEIKDLIIKNGGDYTGNNIEINGKIITAKGPKDAKNFGGEIAKLLNKDLTF